jgi:hypothetical protein
MRKEKRELARRVEQKERAARFGSTKDVRARWGIKQGTLYNLHKLGLIKGVVLLVTGKNKGVRLWDLRSVEAFIEKKFAAQSKASGTRAIAA